MKATDKLRADWSRKKRDVILHYPEGICTKNDAHWLSGIFNQEFIDNLIRRGYDPTTFKFSVEPALGNVKFTSQKES